MLQDRDYCTLSSNWWLLPDEEDEEEKKKGENVARISEPSLFISIISIIVSHHPHLLSSLSLFLILNSSNGHKILPHHNNSRLALSSSHSFIQSHADQDDDHAEDPIFLNSCVCMLPNPLDDDAMALLCAPREDCLLSSNSDQKDHLLWIRRGPDYSRLTSD